VLDWRSDAARNATWGPPRRPVASGPPRREPPWRPSAVTATTN